MAVRLARDRSEIGEFLSGIMKGPLDCGQNEIFPFLFFPAVKLNLGC
jgi:hypothetical protein